MDNMTNQTQSNQQPQQSFSTTLLLKHGRSNTSPIRTMTNGSIMNHSMNMNRLYNSLPGQTTTNVSNGEVNGNNLTSPPNGAPPFEVPLPFGYHLDLDFLRVCSDELVSGETLQKLKELKRQRRKERKQLEALMGITQEQKEREKQRLMQEMPPPMSPIMKKKSPPTTLQLSQPDIIHSSELVREALRESMLSFQETLDQYKDEAGDISDFDLISGGITSTPAAKMKSSKYSTFPRQNLGSPNDDIPLGKLSRQLSNSSISSISTSSSALPYNTPLTPEAYLASLPSSIQLKPDEMETNSIVSISSEMSTSTLRNVREQMARSLAKLKEYEKQVEAIPVLQVKLSVLKEEKRLLMLKLKAREARLRRDRGEQMYESDGAFESMIFDEDMDTDDEDLDSRVAKMSSSLAGGKYSVGNQNQRRARSESPYAKCGMVHPEDFISFQRKRSTSCGFNSDSSDVSPSGGRKYYTKDSAEYAAGRKAKFSRSNEHQNKRPAQSPPVETRDLGVNTDLLLPEPPTQEPVLPPTKQVATRERGSNTDPQPKSPPPTRKLHKGNNTLQIRSIPKGTATELRMAEILSKDEMEGKIQDAVFRTEEEIMSCPLLQKAMQKVEEEALKGAEPPKEFFDMGCQVGLENLRPFVIDMGVLCKLEGEREESKPMADSWCQVSPAPISKADASCGLTGVERMGLMRSIGVGECRIIEEPKLPNKFRTVGVVTEKWVEVIRASKQTDTEDFAYKDTESPRVADIPVEPQAERPDRRQRLSSLTSPCLRNSMSPSVSRRSSTNSPSVSRKSSSASTARTERVDRSVDQRTQGTMTEMEMKVKMPTKDVKVATEKMETRSTATSALILPLNKALPPGSPLSTPEIEQRPPLSLNLCDKCDKDIHQVAAGIISGPPLSPVICPPSPDTPWVSKIPRPCPMENPEVSRLKGATSTGNLSLSSPRSQSPVVTDRMQRSKSNLEPSSIPSRNSHFGYGSSRTPPPQRRDMGTPPPHPKSPAPGSKRAPSPLARSPGPSMSSSFSTTSADKKSLIPKFSPSLQRKTPGATPKTSNPTSPLAESKSFIPRVVTPPALRKMFPKTVEKTSAEEKKTARKQTYNRGQAGITNPDLDKIPEHPKESSSPQVQKKMSDTSEKRAAGGETDSGDDTETLDDTDGMKKASGSFPLPGSALFAPIEPNRKKLEPSKEMKGALKVLNDSLSRGTSRSNAQVTNAVNIIQQEWFKTSSTKQSNPLDVEDYLESIEEMSRELLDQVVNLADVNGNTALHYSVSHGNFDVVSILLDSKVANANILNKAGYTCSMLISLAVISNDSHRAIVKKLFSISDLNLRASQHGQTALMLAVSHGRLDMVQLLTEAGADLNIRDEDGSTALMCAAEHGHLEIVKVLMQHPDINISATDNDGLSALSVAMEAGHRDIGVLLYANMSFSRGTSPHSSIRMKKSSSRSSVVTPSQGSTPVPQAVSSSPIPPTPPHRSRRNSSN